MNTPGVPRCFRGNLAESQAYEDGAHAGARGPGADVNPWRDEARGHAAGFGLAGGKRFHAVMEGTRAACGIAVVPERRVFDLDDGILNCQRCVRAIEAERKRLERAFEAGRLSTHPK